MPRIRFTANIQRHTPCPEETVAGTTLREALEAYFARHEAARPYVLDDQGGLRKHMVIFVDGAHLRDRAHLSDAVSDDGTIDVMQALSGG